MPAVYPFYTGQIPTDDDFNQLAVKSQLAASGGAALIGYGATTVAAILDSISAPPVTSVAGRTGVITLTVADISGAAALNGDATQNFSVKDPTGAHHAVSLEYADAHYAPTGGGGGGGSVSSVSLSLPAEFTVSGSPVTGSGTLSGVWAVQSPHYVLAGPASGAATGTPVFRPLVAADIPTLNQSTTGNAANVTGTVAIANGGTGQATAQAAIDALTAVSGASAGQVFTKDAATGHGVWKNASSTGVTVAILGDSLTALNLAQSQNWPDRMATALNETGSPCRVLNFAVSGGTFYRASNVASFGAQTPLQACIAANPSVVIVMLGANDLLVNIDGRSLGQVEADAASLLSALQAALPSAKLIYVSEICYDNINYAPSTLLNQGVVPSFMTLRSSGILAGCWCPEMLTDGLGSGTIASFSNWATFDSYCRGLSWGGLVNLNYFQTARLGLTVPDNLHPNATGVLNICAQILLGLGSVAGISSFFPGLPGAIGTISANSAGLFSALLASSGGGYVPITTSDGEKFSFEGSGFSREYLPGEWFYPYRGKMTYAPNSTLSYAARQAIIFRITGVAPNTNVELSVAGGAWMALTLNSDDRGEVFYITDSQGFGGTGTFTFRYKIGTSVTPNITITITS